MSGLKDWVRKTAGYERRRKLRKEFFRFEKIIRSQVIYFRMPKVASDTIVEALSSEHAFIPHSYSTTLVRNLLRIKKGVFRFTFVRHPIMRFVSAYKWACRTDIDGTLYPLDIPQRAIIRTTGTPNEFCMLLEQMLQNKKSVRLVHFYPQCVWICSKDKLLVDFVGKLENFDDDLSVLSGDFGVKLDIQFGSNTKNPSVDKGTDPMSHAL